MVKFHHGGSPCTGSVRASPSYYLWVRLRVRLRLRVEVTAKIRVRVRDLGT